MNDSDLNEKFSAARFIKEIGRGPKGSRDLSRHDACDMYTAMLDGRIADLELGAIMIAMRIKGESTEELSGFFDAADASFEHLVAPAGRYAPIVIPSYNGSRQLPNLSPLLALLLAKAGAPVLMHGVMHDEKRVTSADIFGQLEMPLAKNGDEVAQQFAHNLPAFIGINTLAPRLARLLSMREILGVRSSTHTLVKILQPFSTPALRLVSYTHPEYLELLDHHFKTAGAAAQGDAFLMRGTEGEVVANIRRAQKIDWYHAGEVSTLVARQEPNENTPLFTTQADATATAAWIQAIINREQAVPVAIAEQVEHCLYVSQKLREKTAS